LRCYREAGTFSHPTSEFRLATAVAPPPPRRLRGRLLRVLGVGFGLAVIVGNTIGAGILRTPGDIAALLPSMWLFIGAWIAIAGYTFLGSNALAELGTMMPRSGAQYIFARHAFGPYPGFVIGWADWLSTAGSASAVSLVAGEYSGALIPALNGHATLVSVALILIFTAVQWRGVKAGDFAQQATSLLKALLLLALVAACFAFGGRAHLAIAATPHAAPVGMALFSALIVALQKLIYTYDGWNGVLYFSGEVKDPGRDIPRSMFSGAFSVAIIYLLIVLALLYVIPISAMAGDPFPAATAARAVFGSSGETILRVLIFVGMLSSINALVMMAPRVLYALAADGLFARAATTVNPGGTPTVALLLSVVTSVSFVLTGSFDTVAAIMAFLFVAEYLTSFTALFYLRRREPDAPRPYRAWGYPWTVGIVWLVSLGLLVGAVIGDRRNSLWALALIALSYPIYRGIVAVSGPSVEATVEQTTAA
jgi:APA family basic amino acid/polyamine antiporter